MNSQIPSEAPLSFARLFLLIVVVVCLFQISQLVHERARPPFAPPRLTPCGQIRFDRAAGRDPVLLTMAVSPRGDVGLLDSRSGIVQVFGADGTLRASTPSTLPGAGTLLRPQGLTFGDDDELYVADTGNQRIVQFTSRGEIRVMGQPGIFNGQFVLPTALAFQNGNLYVLDTALCRLQLFSTDGSFVARVGERGPLPHQWQRPVGLALDENGNLLVIDTGSVRVTQCDAFLGFLQARQLTAAGGSFPVSRVAVVGNGLSFFLSKVRQELLVFHRNQAVALLTPTSLGTDNAYWTDVCGSADRLYLLDARNARANIFEVF